MVTVKHVRIMMTYRTLSDLEISETSDELLVRGRKLAVVLSTLAVCLCVPFSLSIGYQNIVGTGQQAAIWNRPVDDRIAVVSILFFLNLFFVAVPIAFCVMYLRRHRRPWIFNRLHGQLRRQNQSWPLEDLTDVAVDVIRSKARKEIAAVVLNFRNIDKLEIARFHSGQKGPSIQNRIIVAGDLANAIGDFLQVPVRHPPAASQGFEVAMPVRG